MGPLLAVNRDFYKCLLPKCLGPGGVNVCVVLGAETGLKQRREIGLEDEAEAKACVQTSGEAGKSLAEPEQAGEVGRAAPATALQ